jgi:hypothetical protein
MRHKGIRKSFPVIFITLGLVVLVGCQKEDKRENEVINKQTSAKMQKTDTYYEFNFTAEEISYITGINIEELISKPYFLSFTSEIHGFMEQFLNGGFHIFDEHGEIIAHTQFVDLTNIYDQLDLNISSDYPHYLALNEGIKLSLLDAAEEVLYAATARIKGEGRFWRRVNNAYDRLSNEQISSDEYRNIWNTEADRLNRRNGQTIINRI